VRRRSASPRSSDRGGRDLWRCWKRGHHEDVDSRRGRRLAYRQRRSWVSPASTPQQRPPSGQLAVSRRSGVHDPAVVTGEEIAGRARLRRSRRTRRERSPPSAEQRAVCPRARDLSLSRSLFPPGPRPPARRRNVQVRRTTADAAPRLLSSRSLGESRCDGAGRGCATRDHQRLDHRSPRCSGRCRLDPGSGRTLVIRGRAREHDQARSPGTRRICASCRPDHPSLATPERAGQRPDTTSRTALALPRSDSARC